MTEVADAAALVPTTASWLLWSTSSDASLPLPRAVDDVLHGYTFYPESDWATFGYRPPENHAVCGSWRDERGTGFVFLLEKSSSSPKSESQYLLQVAGDRSAVDDVGRKISALKVGLTKAEKRLLSVRHADQRLALEHKSPAVTSLIKLVGLFTVLVNAFSLYLRQLPLPSLPSETFQSAYQAVVLLVHFSAIGLLLLITLIGFVYAIRYAVLMLRRL